MLVRGVKAAETGSRDRCRGQGQQTGCAPVVVSSVQHVSRPDHRTVVVMGHPSSQFRGLAQCRSRHPSIHGLERKHTQVSTTHKVMFCEPLTSRVLRSSTHTGHTQNTSLNAQQQQLAMTGQPAGYRRAGGQGCEVRLWLTEGAGGVDAQHELLVLLPRRHRHAILTGTEACSTQPTLKQRSSIPSTLRNDAMSRLSWRGGIEGPSRTY